MKQRLGVDFRVDLGLTMESNRSRSSTSSGRSGEDGSESDLLAISLVGGSVEIIVLPGWMVITLPDDIICHSPGTVR